jgi:hypothetical protein
MQARSRWASHAAVTARAHYGRMRSGPDDQAGRAGVLILRVWLEEGGDSRLRIRLVGSPNLDDHDDYDAVAASSVEDALAYVRHWLERFTAGHALPSQFLVILPPRAGQSRGMPRPAAKFADGSIPSSRHSTVR